MARIIPNRDRHVVQQYGCSISEVDSMILQFLGGLVAVPLELHKIDSMHSRAYYQTSATVRGAEKFGNTGVEWRGQP